MFDVEQHHKQDKMAVSVATLPGSGKPVPGKLQSVLPLKKSRVRKDVRASTSDREWRSGSSAARSIERREARLRATARHTARAAKATQNLEPRTHYHSSTAAARDRAQETTLVALFDNVQIFGRLNATAFIEEVEVVDDDSSTENYHRPMNVEPYNVFEAPNPSEVIVSVA